MDCLTVIKDIANIIFFIGVPSVAYLAYKQASKTVFSPQKNELFKLQLEDFKKCLVAMNFSSERALITRCGIDKGLQDTIEQLAYEYLCMKGLCEIEKIYRVVDTWTWSSEHSKYDSPSKQYYPRITDNADETSLEEWIKALPRGMASANRLYDEIKSLRELSSSPFLPTIFRNALTKIESEMEGLYMGFYDQIYESKKDMCKQLKSKNDGHLVAVSLTSDMLAKEENKKKIKSLFEQCVKLQNDIRIHIKTDAIMNE